MDEFTHVAVPKQVFQTLNQILISLPYGQVKGIIDAINDSARGINVPSEDKVNGGLK